MPHRKHIDMSDPFEGVSVHGQDEKSPTKSTGDEKPEKKHRFGMRISTPEPKTDKPE